MNTCAWPHNSTTCRTMQTHQIQQHVSGNTTLVEQNALAKQKLNSVATETLMSSNAPGWQSGPSALFDPQVPFFFKFHVVALCQGQANSGCADVVGQISKDICVFVCARMRSTKVTNVQCAPSFNMNANSIEYKLCDLKMCWNSVARQLARVLSRMIWQRMPWYSQER